MASPSSSHANTVPPISRTVLERHSIAGTDRETEVILVIYQPGVSAPPHHHASAGFNYVLEGTAETAYGGETPKRYQAGEVFMDQAKVPHTVFRNADPRHVLRFLIVADVRKNQPYTYLDLSR
ncbi:cupin domain-containing protein [Dyella sp. M7H15-1]|uniref:cupin domain-containing protein n=1 Tax=Dyella sp. M7H15-1 TaxID=2501295 RepID=UPI001004DFA8|nr:cupin domain-containing protein [Dyella sp. M7H15-1]QAU23016.1 cupin domain-containing protein [Dyella sp. M7H15-1]